MQLKVKLGDFSQDMVKDTIPSWFKEYLERFEKLEKQFTEYREQQAAPSPANP